MVSNWQIKKNFYIKSLIIFFTLISFFFLENSNFYNAKNAKDQTTNLIKAISTHDNNISNFFYRGELVGDYRRFIKTINNNSYNKIYIREKLNEHGLCEINKCKFNIYFKNDEKIENELSKEIIFLSSSENFIVDQSVRAFWLVMIFVKDHWNVSVLMEETSE